MSGKDLTRENLDRLAISVGGRVTLGCTDHPDAGNTTIYQDGVLRVVCGGCGFEAARIKVASRAALDQPNQGEARTASRVATTRENGARFETHILRDLDEAERRVESRRSIYPRWESCIQLRTVTTSEWTDLPEETER